jgi:hypothetical protein
VSDLAEFTRPIAGFSAKPESYKIKVFGWFLHSHGRKEHFSAAALNECFDKVHMSRPTNIHSLLSRMCGSRPATLLRDSRGYRLSATGRAEIENLLPVRSTSVVTTALLTDLADRIVDTNQRKFLDECLICFKNQAYRSAIVMAWNLAFSDVLDRILAGDLAKFNAQLVKVVHKSAPIGRRSDFEDYKESKVIEVARGAGILSASSAKVLSEKLNKRNAAAHPSSIVVASVTAEEVIHDLVENIILNPTL